jgi:pyruvate ferredoxin oxidoreductase gamma subunit
MFQVRIHGRGGQGVVTAAELLAIAAFAEGRHAQAFPSFGSERTGAPLVAFCRLDDRPIRSHEPVTEPDALIVQDPTLVNRIDVFAGLAPDGYILLNSRRDLRQLCPERHRDRVVILPATQLALTHVGRPVPNAALLGGFAALTGLISLESVVTAIRDRFGELASGTGQHGSGAVAEGNVAAAREAYATVRRERVHA